MESRELRIGDCRADNTDLREREVDRAVQHRLHWQMKLKWRKTGGG